LIPSSDRWNFTYSEFSVSKASLPSSPIDPGQRNNLHHHHLLDQNFNPRYNNIQDEYHQLLEGNDWISDFPSIPISIFGLSEDGEIEVLKNPRFQTSSLQPSTVDVMEHEGNLFVIPSLKYSLLSIEGPEEDTEEAGGFNPLLAPQCVSGDKCLIGESFRADIGFLFLSYSHSAIPLHSSSKS